MTAATGGYKSYGPELRVEVIGTPVPQGSIRSLGRGRPSVHSNQSDLLPWRDSLAAHTRQAMLRDPLAGWPLSDPCAVDVTFTVRKPASAPKRKRTWPDRRPDVDKLLRAVLDALVIAGAVHDDGQIVEATARKAYPREHVQALDVPGALIYLYRIGESA